MDVVIIEDSAEMRMRLFEALSEIPGAKVVGWADGEDDAIATCRRLRPQFVVLDLKLAQGSGLAVLAALKRNGGGPVVAVLTNYPQPQYRARCAELGADHFFDKADGLDALLEVCRTGSPGEGTHA
jgi:DNA-binding NarL/FixJ family response regulator